MPNQQYLLPFVPDDLRQREALIARWLELVRDILPRIAEQNRWPILQDHCFMRVCLDTALEAPWHTVVRRPAVRHLSDEQLGAAVAVAEALVLAPETLQVINRRSIQWRTAALTGNG